VWIGDGAVILPGVAIGNGAVVAANSVVTKNVEPYSIVAGVPATKIRSRFLDEIIARLQEIRWWELNHDQLLGMRTRNIFDFLEDLSQLSIDYDHADVRLTYTLDKL
jgi:virginiamycin A acetyltransferase